MRDVKFRCSSIGKLMTEPVQIDPRFRTPEIEEIFAKKKRSDDEKAVIARLKLQTLSEGAKTYIRELVAQEIFGVEFAVSSKHIEKGIAVEPDSLALLNRVRGLSLVKNTERRTDDYITGECDLFATATREGRDLKSSWSIATFPIATTDCEDKLYEFQMRGYMRLWNAERWHVDYCLVNTPDHLIGYEPQSLHFVDHIPEHMRVTTWTVTRDRAIEAAMVEKIKHARRYYAEVIEEFDRTHGRAGAPDPAPWAGADELAAARPAAPASVTPPAPAAARQPLPDNIFA